MRTQDRYDLGVSERKQVTLVENSRYLIKKFGHFSTCLGTRSLPSTTAVTNSFEYSMASSLEEKQDQEEANRVSLAANCTSFPICHWYLRSY